MENLKKVLNREGLIENLDNWFNYLKNRNVTVHEYYEEIMEIVYPIIPKFLQDLNSLVAKLSKL